MAESPLIGITVERSRHAGGAEVYQSAAAYAQAITQAGGLPMLLPQEADLARTYARQCQGLVLTGGGDPIMEWFGQTTDPRARRISEIRQTFELALLEAAAEEDLPVLGICLGMQLMGLHAGGSLDQYLPDTLGEEKAAAHQDSREHPLVFDVQDSIIEPSQGVVVSSHRQAIAHTGTMRLVASAPDGTVEAIDNPRRRFYLGVQWHPERMKPAPPGQLDVLNHQLFVKLIDACRHTRPTAASPPRL